MESHRHVVQLGRKLIVDDNLHAVSLHVVKNAGANVLGEWIIFHGKRNEQRLRRLAQILSVLGGEIDGRREVLIRSRQDGEEVAVALGEQLACRAVRLDHRHLMLFDDGQDRLSQARAARPEQEFHPVLLDEPLGKLSTVRGRRLVVVIAQDDLVVLAADLDAALVVDLAGGEIVAVLGVDPVLRIFAGQRNRRSEHDDVVARSSQSEPRCGKHQCGKKAQPKPMRCAQFIDPPPPGFAPANLIGATRLRPRRRAAQSGGPRGSPAA